MLIVMKSNSTQEQIDAVTKRIEILGLSFHVIPGPSRSCICVTGNRSALKPSDFHSLEGIQETIIVSKPYKLVSRDFKQEDTVISMGDFNIGGGSFTVMAGPCSVESYEQTSVIAKSVKSSGANLLRGGAYKPRTSPYSFRGLKTEGLEILKRVSGEESIPIITEVMDTETLEAVYENTDILQIGARNMQNFTLLEAVGKLNKPVMLKRGMSATIEELLLAAEYVLKGGNSNLMFCERGVRTFEPMTRNTLDLSAVVVLKRLSHLPVIVDPSHGIGINYGVAPLARAAVAVGADGVIVEVHNEPEKALSDGQQALLPQEFDKLMRQIKAIHKIVNEID